MDRKSFSPHTRQEDERLITRKQKDFSAGVYKDIPSTTIPENGLAELVDAVNYGEYIDGRSGSKEWGDYATFTPSASLPTTATGIAATSTVVGLERTIEISDGYSFTSSNVGDYFVHDDGTNERIESVTDTDTIVTRTESSDAKTSTAASLRAQVNGLYYHRFKKKVILHIGQELYVSTRTMTSWTQAHFVGSSFFNLGNSISKMDELDNYLIIYNVTGIYKLDLDSTPYLFHPINTEVPSTLLTDTGTGLYQRKLTYTLLRLSGTGNRDRTTSGVTIEQESGSCKVNSDYKDYSTASSTNEISASNAIIVGNLENPVDSDGSRAQQWTHYGVYCTLDVGVNGTDPVTGEGNNSELYIWLADIPLAKTFVGDVTGYVIQTSEGTFQDSDVGVAIRIDDSGSQADYAISSVVDANTAVLQTVYSGSSGTPFTVDSGNDLIVASGHGITDSGQVVSLVTTSTLPSPLEILTPYYATNINTNDFQLATTYAKAIAGTDDINISDSGVGTHTFYGTTDLSGTVMAIGGEAASEEITLFEFTQDSGGSFVIGADYAGVLNSGDVNKTIWLSDGSYRHITAFASDSGTVAEVGASYTITTPKAAAIDPTVRNFADGTEDDTLRTRIAGYPLQQRFYEPLPSSDIGEVVPGFMFTAVRDENRLYYSQLPDGYEYQMGYYHPTYQNTFVKGAIRAIKQLPDKLAIYCTGSTYTVPLNVTDVVDLSAVGASITVLGGINLADDTIGLLDYGSLVAVDIGKHIMITNEPAIRIFNGNSYSENIVSQRLMEDLQNLQMATSAVYHAIIGYVFWGNNE